MMQDDHALAVDVAVATGRLLLALRAHHWLDGALLGGAGDAVAQAFIARVLAERRPADAILSEEAVDDGRRLGAHRVWIVDPLDGTREFSERRDDWAVHVALCEGGNPIAAAVAIPARDECFGTRDAQLAPAARAGMLRVVASRTRAPALVARVAAHIGAQVVPMGSAGAKFGALLRGDADVYLHAGGQHEWDSCAPVGVARAAGLYVARLDGSPLRYNRRDASIPDLVACRPELEQRVRAAIAAG